MGKLCDCSEFGGTTGDIQSSPVSSLSGRGALKVYNGLSFESEEDRQNLSKILEKLEEYAIGEVNETYERYVFNSRNQGASESIEAYITELRKLMKTCNFCDCLKDTLLRDRIVLGVANKNLRKRLL